MSEVLSYTVEIKGIQQTVTNLDSLTKALQDNAKWLKMAEIGSKDYEKALINQNGLKVFQKEITATSQAIIKANQVVGGMNRNLQNSQTASANASMALLNLNYVIRDSPYFFQNFALGVLAVGNNLNPLIDSFSRLRAEAGEKSISTMALLRQALVGGAGISIAFSLVVTAIQAFVFWQAKASRETDKTKEAVDGLTKSLENMLDVKMPSSDRKFPVDPEKLPSLIAEVKAELENLKLGQGWIDLKKSYGGKSWNDDNKKAQENLDKDVENQNKLKALLEEKLKFYESELLARELLKKLGIEDVAVHEEKIKKLKEEKEALRDLGLAYRILMARRMGGFNYDNEGIIGGLQNAFDEKQSKMYNKYGRRMSDPRPVGRSGIEYITQDLEEAKLIMQAASNVANIAGNAISNAFLSGKNAIDAATQALKQFIVQLLVVQTIKGFFNAITGGVGGFIGGFTDGLVGTNTSLPKIANPSLGVGKSNVQRIEVYGNLKANKNSFAAEITTAQANYDRKVKVASVGRS